MTLPVRTRRRSGALARKARAAGLALQVAAGVVASTAAAQSADEQQSPSGIYGFDDDEQDETLPSPQGVGSSREPTSPTHAVRKGDTLWDISRAYFRDPWRWPKVWALNPEIANPHWIFPGQAIRLRDSGAAAPATGATAGALPPPAVGSTAPVGVLTPPPGDSPRDANRLRQIGFVDEGGLKAAGVINGSLEEKILLATGDHAYVEFPADRPPKGGARYTVYRVDSDHPITEPNSNLVLGYLVHVYGDIVIDGLTDRPIANARLVDLAEPVERGYRVGPVIRQLKSVAPRQNRAETTARIVASVQPNLLIANQMFVVLNRGQRHGVEVGNRFLVLRQGDGLKRIMESWDASDHRFPPHAVAEIFAVDVQNETTVGWISRGTRELHTGDVADLRRGY
ncbi:MAG: LysM peptidoglycan-binding domain-containing protein [Bacteroidota bacterium]